MSEKDKTRRNFIKNIAGATVVTALAGCASTPARSYMRIVGANDRIKMGVVGCGGMANGHMNALLKMKNSDNVDIVAVCDVYNKRMNQAAQKTNGKAIQDYRTLLDMKEIDYVLIATPEHWHFQMTMDAIEAEKTYLC